MQMQERLGKWRPVSLKAFESLADSSIFLCFLIQQNSVPNNVEPTEKLNIQCTVRRIRHGGLSMDERGTITKSQKSLLGFPILSNPGKPQYEFQGDENCTDIRHLLCSKEYSRCWHMDT
jgi:hypothetical protein